MSRELSTRIATSGPACWSPAPPGLVGNNVTRLLVQRRINVRVLVRKQSDSRSLEGLDVELADRRRDRSRLAGGRHGRGSPPSSTRPDVCCWAGRTRHLHESINHQGTRNVARAAREAGARMVHVSTINTLGVGTRDRPADEEWSAAPNIPCPYVVSKQAGEQAVRSRSTAGLDAVDRPPGTDVRPLGLETVLGPHAAASGSQLHAHGTHGRL